MKIREHAVHSKAHLIGVVTDKGQFEDLPQFKLF